MKEASLLLTAVVGMHSFQHYHRFPLHIKWLLANSRSHRRFMMGCQHSREAHHSAVTDESISIKSPVDASFVLKFEGSHGFESSQFCECFLF